MSVRLLIRLTICSAMFLIVSLFVCILEGSPVANVADSWFEGLVTDDLETDIELSSKFYILMEIVRSAEAVGDKVLVFSQSLLTLNLLESFIQEEEFGGFCLGIDYYRLDGSSSADSRQAWADNFNSKKKKRFAFM